VRELNEDPDVRRRLETTFIDPSNMTTQEFSAVVKADASKWARIVGEANIKSGLKLRALNPLAFTSMLSGFVDKKSGYAAGPFVARINQILAGLHADGTLSALSVKFYGVDYAKEAGQFDLSTIGQNVT